MSKSILDLFDQTVARYAEKIAVECEEGNFTFRQLQEEAQRIGSFLTDKISLEQPVAVVGFKSFHVLSAMLGILYAGGFYVPVDPEQPSDRLGKILEVLESKVVLTDTVGEQAVKDCFYDGSAYLISEICSHEIDQNLLGDVRAQISGEDTLYGIFTSGSTGVPKCISISHKSVIDFIGHFSEIFEFSAEDRIANQAPFDFDVSVKDIYTSLFTGATLVLVDRRLFAAPKLLLDFLCEKKVTNLTWAVSALCIVTTFRGFDYKVPTTLRRVMFSGEVMPHSHLVQWMEALPETLFVNLYGPSEITCNCTYEMIPHGSAIPEKLSLGTTFPGREVFLIDESGMRVTAPHVVGELCVQGESLAKGYYKDAKRTDAAFVMIANNDGDIVRTYRTGDLAEYHDDQKLYFAGRADFQIKHMGHRIELEEIESAISKVFGVTRCCVQFDTVRNKIVAFLVAEVEKAEIRKQLKTTIPAYMIPSKWIFLDDIPLTKNGKIDRKQLQQLMH